MAGEVGTVFKVQPVPHIPDNTSMVAAGVVTIGLEHRPLGPPDAMSRERYAGDPDVLGVIDRMAAGDAHGGPTLHVFATDTGVEYLRFDCFDVEPHYHYLTPATDESPMVNRVVSIDEDAVGPPLAWAVEVVRSRLASMLGRVGAGEIAVRLDAALLDRALDEVAAASASLVARV